MGRGGTWSLSLLFARGARQRARASAPRLRVCSCMCACARLFHLASRCFCGPRSGQISALVPPLVKWYSSERSGRHVSSVRRSSNCLPSHAAVGTFATVVAASRWTPASQRNTAVFVRRHRQARPQPWLLSPFAVYWYCWLCSLCSL